MEAVPKEFVDNSPGGTAGESMTLNSVVNSLTELSYVKKIQFGRFHAWKAS
jgi:hypothetical protein